MIEKTSLIAVYPSCVKSMVYSSVNHTEFGGG